MRSGRLALPAGARQATVEALVPLGESLLSGFRLPLLSIQRPSGLPRLSAVLAELLYHLAVGLAAFLYVATLFLQACPPALVELAVALLAVRLRRGRLVAVGFAGSVVLGGQASRQQQGCAEQPSQQPEELFAVSHYWSSFLAPAFHCS